MFDRSLLDGRLPVVAPARPKRELSMKPDAVRARAYRARNVARAREQYKKDAHKWRAKGFAGGTYLIEEWLALCEAAEWKCLRCRLPKKLTIDHVIPIELGGPNVIENIQPLCNMWKGFNSDDFRPAPAELQKYFLELPPDESAGACTGGEAQ